MQAEGLSTDAAKVGLTAKLPNQPVCAGNGRDNAIGGDPADAVAVELGDVQAVILPTDTLRRRANPASVAFSPSPLWMRDPFPATVVMVPDVP
ncbi:MAG: hypothetical protein MJE77_12590, partial [Proteobacteria bacterium]|nr:hypothetical protein [Pseudomonadota bacterium]